MVDISATGYSKLARIQRIMERAIDNNPYQKAAMSSPPTINISATTDPTLAASVPLVASNALTAAATSKMAWYGGLPLPVANAYVVFPVTSTLPATVGNIAGFANAFGVTNDMNSWAGALELMTDSDKIEFCIYCNNARKVMFQVDGQYVDFTGSTGLGASNADTFFELTFASRKVRRIRVLLSTLPSSAPTLPKAIRVNGVSSFWKPSQKDVIRCGFFGDSYSEGTNGSLSIYPIPNAAWPVIACELLGIRDCRQLAVGGTGYLATGVTPGTRSTFRQLLTATPLIAAQGPYDMFIVGHSYNDYTQTPSAVTAEALLAYKALRALYPGIPIVALGSQAGARGPDATTIAIENAVSAAVTSFNDKLCKFAPVSTDAQTWLNGTGKNGTTNGSGNSDLYVDQDGIHPSGPNLGAEYLAYRTAIAVRNAFAAMG